MNPLNENELEVLYQLDQRQKGAEISAVKEDLSEKGYDEEQMKAIVREVEHRVMDGVTSDFAAKSAINAIVGGIALTIAGLFLAIYVNSIERASHLFIFAPYVVMVIGIVFSIRGLIALKK